MYDLKITNALIVDGTGAAPYQGEIGIVGDRLTAVGSAPDAAKKEIDAHGQAVAPGFVDVHTHLDAQVLWDQTLSCSSWHGVTTVVTGNCGISLGPVTAECDENLLRTLVNVEGMDYDCLVEGTGGQGFRTFGAYLDAVEQLGPTINLLPLVGHTALRMGAMGGEAADREATPEELRAMVRLLRESLDAGAAGLSTSRLPSHIGYEKKPIASRLASLEENTALVEAMAAHGAGIFQAAIGPGLSLAELRELNERTGLATTAGGILARDDRTHLKLLREAEEYHAAGFTVAAQVSARPVRAQFTLKSPDGFAMRATAMARLPVLTDLFAPVVAAATTTEKLAVYADSTFRADLIEATGSSEWHKRIWAKTELNQAAGHDDLEGRSLADIAAEWKVHPAEALLELGVSSELETSFVLAILNSDEDDVAELLVSPATQVGLSDAGAHVNETCDAGFATHLLERFVRTRGAISIEAAVKMLTSDGARLFGVHERGELRPGWHADVVVFDPTTVAALPPHRVWDFPGGAPRMVSESVGVTAVLVNGTIIRNDAAPVAGARPGTVLRHGGQE